ncbi:4Fe-4S single cluster domain-containing protein [Staphylospora marina]|uniref:4Fe-4S single cluster domain-containing protein n=1 Tax=Staphylospora marina TaxID=2490858 RepID=UPI000F5BB232|nr:4Fe-4S single cluster domain-containing protein [Staphylospora marina]
MSKPNNSSGSARTDAWTGQGAGGDLTLRLHRFLPKTRAEGPGIRACIWVQGCSIRCPGCAVPWTWSPNGGETVTVGELARRILEGPEVEGVTFAGGEPFDQAAPLAALGRMLKHRGMSVVTYSGYRLEELRAASRPDWHALLGVTDILLDGPFMREKADVSRPWVGSSNQRIHFLTDRYAFLKPELGRHRNRLEIRLERGGIVTLNGVADMDALQELLEELELERESPPKKGKADE